MIGNSTPDQGAPVAERPVWRSARAWLVVLTFLFFSTHGYFSFQSAGTDSTATSSLAGLNATHNGGVLGYVVIPGVVYAIVAAFLLRNGRTLARFAMGNKVVSALALLAMVSAAWSQNPLRSAEFGFFYVLNTLFAFFLVARFRSEQIRGLAVMTGCLLAAVNLVMVFVFPRYGVVHLLRDLGSWNGIFIDRTSCAKCLVFLLSAAVSFTEPRFTPFQLVYIAVLLVLIVKAHAVTALLVLMVYGGTLGFLALQRRMERRTGRFVAALTATAVLAAATLGPVVLPAVLALFGRDMTFTGRTGVWLVLVQSLAKRPLLGYGFYAFWQGLQGESANAILTLHWVFGYAHNGILEIALQLGIVGVALFFLTFAQAVRNAMRCLRSGRTREVDWYVGLLILTCLYNVDEATVVWPNELLSIFYLVACCGLQQAAAHLPARERVHENGINPQGVPGHEPHFSLAG